MLILLSCEMKCDLTSTAENLLNRFIRGKITELQEQEWVTNSIVPLKPNWFNQIKTEMREFMDQSLDKSSSFINPFFCGQKNFVHRLELIAKKVIFFTRLVSYKIRGSLSEATSGDLESFHNKLKNLYLESEKSLLTDAISAVQKEVESQLAFCGMLYLFIQNIIDMFKISYFQESTKKKLQLRTSLILKVKFPSPKKT